MPVARLLGPLALVGALALSPAARAATPETSTTDRPKDRREVAAGDRAYVEGFEDGRFYANGWHITGEMGGVWTPPLKLVDGVWFGLDAQWVDKAGGAASFARDLARAIARYRKQRPRRSPA